MLKGPGAEDIRKLHNEVSLIVNQRFLLTTLSITMSGILISWMVPTRSQTSDLAVGDIQFVLSIILLVLLFALFLWNQFLGRTLRIYTTYLREVGNSGWESDWREFRKYWNFAHTKPQAIIFMTLSAITWLFPLAMTFISTSVHYNCLSVYASTLVFVAFEFTMFFMAFTDRFQKEEEFSSIWARLNRSEGEHA